MFACYVSLLVCRDSLLRSDPRFKPMRSGGIFARARRGDSPEEWSASPKPLGCLWARHSIYTLIFGWISIAQISLFSLFSSVWIDGHGWLCWRFDPEGILIPWLKVNLDWFWLRSSLVTDVYRPSSLPKTQTNLRLCDTWAKTVAVSPSCLCQHKTPEESGDICCGLPFSRATCVWQRVSALLSARGASRALCRSSHPSSEMALSRRGLCHFQMIRRQIEMNVAMRLWGELANCATELRVESDVTHSAPCVCVCCSPASWLQARLIMLMHLFLPIFRSLPPTLNTPQTVMNDGQRNAERCAVIYKAKQRSHQEARRLTEPSVTSLSSAANRNNH